MSRNRAAILLLLLSTMLLPVLVNKAYAASDVRVFFETLPPDTVNAGEIYEFRVCVDNLGPDNANDVVLEYRPPLGASVVGISSTLGPCEAGTKNDPHDPALCFLGALSSGESVLIRFRVKVDTYVPPGTVLDNDLRVYHAGSDSYPPNNQELIFVKVKEGKVADLKLRMVGKPDGRVKTGENLTYTAIVDNLGPSNATNVHLVMKIVSSGEFTFLDAKIVANNWAWNSEYKSLPEWGKWIFIIEFNLFDELPVGGESYFLLRLKADTPQDINNLAEVSWDYIDPDTDSNYVATMHEVVLPSLVGGFLMPVDATWIPPLLLAAIVTAVYELIHRRRRQS